MVQIQTVGFHNDVVDIIDNSVSIKKLCKNLGIQDYQAQQARIKADDAFESKLIDVEINGIIQSVLCIPLSKLNGWLFSINPNKVKPEVKQKLIEYKNECFDVLHNYFNNCELEPDEDLVQVVLRQNSMIAKYSKDYDDTKKIRQAYVNVRWRVSALVEQTRKHIADQSKLLEILEKDMEIMDMYEEFHGPYELVKPKRQKLLK